MSRTLSGPDLMAILDTLDRIRLATLEAVADAGPLGAPASMIYLAFRRQGPMAGLFDGFMQSLIDVGSLIFARDCYTITPSGLEHIARLKKYFAQPKNG